MGGEAARRRCARGIVAAVQPVLATSFALCAIAGACSVTSPVGTWEIDKAAMRAAASKLPAADVERMLAGIAESTMELSADGSATLRAKVLFDGRTIEDATTGTWTLDGRTLAVVAKSRRGPDVVEVFDYAGNALAGSLSTAKLRMIYRRR
jgi:hypothetical protein